MHGEGGRGTGFRGYQTGSGHHRNAGLVVIRVNRRNIGGIEATVGGIITNGRRQKDGVGLRPIDDIVIHSGDGNRLRHVPVIGREGEGGGGGHTFGGVAGGNADGYISNRRIIQGNHKVIGSAIFRGVQPIGGRDGDVWRGAGNQDKGGHQLARGGFQHRHITGVDVPGVNQPAIPIRGIIHNIVLVEALPAFGGGD